MARITDLPPEVLSIVFQELSRESEGMKSCMPTGRYVVRTNVATFHLRHVYDLVRQKLNQLLTVQLVNKLWWNVLLDTKLPGISFDKANIYVGMGQSGLWCSVIYELHSLKESDVEDAIDEMEGRRCFCAAKAIALYHEESKLSANILLADKVQVYMQPCEKGAKDMLPLEFVHLAFPDYHDRRS